jgi:hypothetical protein
VDQAIADDRDRVQAAQLAVERIGSARRDDTQQDRATCTRDRETDRLQRRVRNAFGPSVGPTKQDTFQ